MRTALQPSRIGRLTFIAALLIMVLGVIYLSIAAGSSSPKNEIQELQVLVFRKQDNRPIPLGTIGENCRVVASMDFAKIEVKLSRPGFVTLFSFSPNGKCEIASFHAESSLRVVFPQPDGEFLLINGKGSQAYVVICTESPIPQEILDILLDQPWQSQSFDEDYPWTYRNGQFLPLAPNERSGTIKFDSRPDELNSLIIRFQGIEFSDLEAIIFRVDDNATIEKNE